MATRSVIIKRTAIGAAIVIVLLVVLVALLPALISAGVGHGAIRSAIEDRLAPGSRVQFQTLSVSWGGPQEIRRLRIVDPQGEEVADVNLRISPGLWGLLFGTLGVLEANVSGTIRGEIYEDGTTSFARLVETNAREPDPGPARPMAGVPPLVLRVDAIDLFLMQTTDALRREVVVRDFAGFLTYSPAGRPAAADPSQVSFEFAARTTADNVQGDMQLTGQSRNLFDADGAFTPEGAPVNVSLNATNVPLLGMDVPTILTRLALAVNADNLAQHVAANVESEAVIQDEPPSRFRAEINVRVPFRPDGTLDVTLENIAATATGERVPASLLQPMLAATPIVVTRDVGRSIDLDAQVSPGDGTAVIRAVGERASLDVSAMHDADTGWWRGDRLVLTSSRAHPDLVHGFTNLTVDRPVNLEISMTQFGFPPVDPALDRRPLTQYSATGVLRVNEPVGVIFNETQDETQAGAARNDAPGQRRTILVEQAEIQFDSPMLGDYLDLAGTLRADGGVVRLQQRITNMFDAAGGMDVMNANLTGEIVADDLPTRTVAQWMPDQEENLRELLGEAIDINLTTSVEEAGQRVVLAASGAQTQANVELLRRPDALEISRTFAEVTLTPALVQRFQQTDEDAEEDPIALLESTLARLELDPITLRGARFDEYRLEQRDIRGRLTVGDLAMTGLPGIPEAVSVHDVSANIVATLARDPLAETPEVAPGDEPPPLLASYALQGGAGVRHYANGASVASITYNLTGRPGAGDDAQQPTQLDGEITLADLNVETLERVLGREPGQFELWLGRTGNINAQFSAAGQRYNATLVPEMPRLRGTFTASYADDLIALNTQNASLSLGADALAKMLGGDEARIVVERDVPLTLNLNAQLPMGFVTQEAFEPTLLDMRAEMRGGPLVMRMDDQRQTLDDVELTVTADATREEALFRIVLEGETADTAASAPAPPPGAIGAPPQRQSDQRRGNINVRGTLREPVTPGQPLTFERSILDLDATFNRAPTALADAFLQMNGRLIAIIGAHIDGTITARELARGPLGDGGTLNLDLRSPNGFLRGSGVGREGALHVSQESPIEAQLEITPLMRDMVLSRLHPIFMNMLVAEEPLRASFASAAIPLDGDVSKLSGDARLVIGEISLDRRSPMFGILALPVVGEAAGTAVGASIDPINARIRNGRIEYERFNMRLSVMEMAWGGSINLVDRQVRLRTTVPLGSISLPAVGLTRLGDAVRELSDIEVPLVIRGPIGDPLRMELDPEFDLAGQILRMGAERGLRDFLDPNRDGPGRILRDLIRPPRRE